MGLPFVIPQDIGDQLEKRVKSRFSSNYVAIYNKVTLDQVCEGQGLGRWRGEGCR
jgi:hypothetical protein